MELAVSNPNLSVILPVGCNAKCDFCYWEKSTGLTPSKFKEIVNTLPNMFKQISITGGETTLASDLLEYLQIAKQRFSKVVLNTNGYNLQKEHFDHVNHVNISRHHWLDSKNYKIFNTTTVPSTQELKKICSYGDVTFNCVLPSDFNDNLFIRKYVDYAKELGAKVAFRKYFDNLDILSVDTDDTLISSHSCPACLHRQHIINDVHVTFKYSVQETCEAINGIYELVLQSNGDLTIDWAGKLKLEYKEQ